MTNKEELREKIRLIVRSELDSVYGNGSHKYTPKVGEKFALDKIMHLIDEQTRATYKNIDKQTIINKFWTTFVTEQWDYQVNLSQRRVEEADTEEAKKLVQGIAYSHFTEEAFWCWWIKLSKDKDNHVS